MVIKQLGSESSPIVLYDTTEELSNPNNNRKSEIRQEGNQDSIDIQNFHQIRVSSADNESTEERDPNKNDRQIGEDTLVHSSMQNVCKGVEDLSLSPNLGTMASFEDAATAINSIASEGVSKLNLHQATENPTQVVVGITGFETGFETALVSCFEDAAMAIYSTAKVSEAASTLESMGKSVGEALESVPLVDREEKEMTTEVEAEMSMYRSLDTEVSIGRSVYLMSNCVREALQSIPFVREDVEKIAKIEARMLKRHQRLQDMKKKLSEARVVNQNLRRSEAMKIRKTLRCVEIDLLGQIDAFEKQISNY